MSQGQQTIFYVEVGGLRRRYVMYRPHRVVEEGALAPVMIMLDGRGGTAWTAMRTTGWNDVADRAGLVMIYPEATRIDPEGPLHFLTNPQMWDAGSGGSDVERPPVDEVAFLDAVMDDMFNQARLDRRRCYMTGFSNGAAMTYRYALANPDRLAGIAPVAGHLRVEGAGLPKPVPMISFFGRLDPLSPYEGGWVDLPWGKREERPTAVASVRRWAALCGHDPEAGRVVVEPGVTRLHYGAPGARDEVLCITVDDLGHVWPGGHRLIPESIVGPSSNRIVATDTICAFFGLVA